MSQAYWSKAPEWAGVVIKSPCGREYFVEAWGVKSKRQQVGSSRIDTLKADTSGEDHSWTLVEKRPAAWNGEGKPPVGAVCEVWHKAPHKEWAHHVGKQATIVCHDGPRTVYRVESEQGFQYHGLGGGAGGESWPFRPLRTPEQITADEQIAAEEREAKAKAMYLSVYFLESAQGWDRIPEATRETFRKAIDAGWQQVTP